MGENAKLKMAEEPEEMDGFQKAQLYLIAFSYLVLLGLYILSRMV